MRINCMKNMDICHDSSIGSRVHKIQSTESSQTMWQSNLFSKCEGHFKDSGKIFQNDLKELICNHWWSARMLKV